MKHLTKTTAILLAVVALPLAGLAEEKTQDPPNVLFILVDDMGWRDLACYGHEIHETPNIDKLAAGGMRFTNAYAACPICAPSRAAIMTGKFPSNTGFVDNYTSQLKGQTLARSKERQFLELEHFTLAEAFQASGYQTGFLGKWHLSVGMEPRLPTDQGFDVNVAGSFWGHPLKGYFSPYHMPNLEEGREELYNLKDDIGESKNLARSMPEKAAKMKARLDAVLKAHDATVPISVPETPSRPVRKKRTRATQAWSSDK